MNYGEISSAPPWLIEKAVQAELAQNWKGAYEEVLEKEVPKGANVIGSHVIFKIKVEEGGHKRCAPMD